ADSAAALQDQDRRFPRERTGDARGVPHLVLRRLVNLPGGRARLRSTLDGWAIQGGMSHAVAHRPARLLATGAAPDERAMISQPAPQRLPQGPPSADIPLTPGMLLNGIVRRREPS